MSISTASSRPSIPRNGTPRSCARTSPSACSQRKRADDLDQQFYENYVCGAERNFGGYCKRKLDELIDGQSIEPDREKPEESSGGNVGSIRAAGTLAGRPLVFCANKEMKSGQGEPGSWPAHRYSLVSSRLALPANAGLCACSDGRHR